LWYWILKFSRKHQQPIEKCLWQNFQNARVNKPLSLGALRFVFSLCHQVNKKCKSCRLCDRLFCLNVLGLGALCLFETRENLAFLYKNRVASLPKLCLTSACPPTLKRIIVGMVSHLNLRGRLAIFVLFQSRAANF
jgi:hypothetical protein